MSEFNSSERRACLRCNGEKTTFRAGFTYQDTTYPDETKTCSSCNGEGFYTTPAFKAIFDAITTSRGAKEGKRKFRATPDKKWGRFSDIQGSRIYYVWRLARFHGGKDTTMPMMADLAIRNDPFHKELSDFSEEVAKAAFGTDMAGAYAWGRAFGII